MQASSVDRDERALHLENAASLDVQRPRRFDGDLWRVDSQRRRGFDGGRTTGTADHDAIAVPGINRDGALVYRDRLAIIQLQPKATLRAVFEPERVALARADGADVVAPIGVGDWWFVVVIPQRTEDIGEPKVSALERDEHLVVDLRQKIGAVTLSRHGRREPGPVRLFRPAVPRKTDSDASQTIRVAVVSNNCGGYAVDRVGAHSAPMLHQLFTSFGLCLCSPARGASTCRSSPPRD